MKDNKHWGDALYCDCENDLERSFFFSSGRAVETGIVAPAIALDVARAFYAADEIERLQREVRYLRHYGNKDCTHMADQGMANGEMEENP